MRFLIISFLFVQSLANAQSITLTPNGGSTQISSSKIGSNNVKIEGRSYSDVLYNTSVNGHASISLIGNPSNNIFNDNSSLSLNFFHGSTKRFSILDDFSSPISGDQINSFKIEDIISNSITHTPLEIVKGSNTVTLNNLAIKSMSSTYDEGKFLKIGANGNIISSPNQFEIIGALDLTTFSGSFTKNLLGSYGPDAIDQTIYAPVHLPHGSVITKITITYKDNSLTNGLSVSFRIHSGTTENIIATAASKNIKTPANATMQPNSYSNLVVDNTIYQYYLVISPCNQANTNTGVWDGQNIKFVKAVIEYQ